MTIDPATAVDALNAAFGTDDLEQIVRALQVLAKALGRAGYGAEIRPPRVHVAYKRST